MRFADVKNKNDFIEFVQQQTNVKLENDKTDALNKKRNVLYTKVEKKNRLCVLGLMNKNSVRLEEHMKGYYWVYYKENEKEV